MIKKQPVSDFYITIGQRLRFFRTRAGFNQTTLANILGVTYQQLQKYETGVNRLSIEDMLDSCKALDTSIEEFLGDCFVSDDGLSIYDGKVFKDFTSLPDAQKMIVSDLIKKLAEDERKKQCQTQ